MLQKSGHRLTAWDWSQKTGLVVGWMLLFCHTCWWFFNIFPPLGMYFLPVVNPWDNDSQVGPPGSENTDTVRGPFCGIWGFRGGWGWRWCYIFLVDVGAEVVGVDGGEGSKVGVFMVVVSVDGWWLLLLMVVGVELNYIDVNYISSMPLHWPLQMPKICAPKILQKAWDMDFVDCIMVPDGEVRFETSKISVEFGWWCSVSRHPRFRWFAVQEEGNTKRH